MYSVYCVLHLTSGTALLKASVYSYTKYDVPSPHTYFPSELYKNRINCVMYKHSNKFSF